MDNESRHAVRLFESLADWNFEFTKLAQKFRPHPDVLRVSSNIEHRKYQSGTVIESYVELELKNDKSLCWWLEVRWDDKNWFIDSRILLNDLEGQNTIHQFDERLVTTLDSFLLQLSEAIQELVRYDALSLPGIILS